MVRATAGRVFLPGRTFPSLLVAISGLWASSCRCSEDRPYTPFSITTALPSAGEGSAPVPPVSSSAKESLASVGVVAPPNAKSWSVFGVTLDAPTDQIWKTALRLESGQIVAYSEGPKTNAPDGIWLVSSDGASRKEIASIKTLPKTQGCTRSVELRSAGPSALSVNARASCREAVLSGSPEAEVLVIDTERGTPLLLEVETLARNDGIRLDFAATVLDQDKDGESDLELTVGLGEGGKGPKLAFRWLSRSVGLSRIPDEPAKSIDSWMRKALVSAIRKAERGSIPVETRDLRVLYSTVCAESQSSRVRVVGAPPLACGNLTPVLERASRAAVLAEFGLKNPGRALGEAVRSGYFGSPTAQEKKALTEIVRKELARGDAIPVTSEASAEAKKSQNEATRFFFSEDEKLFFRSSSGSIEQKWPKPAPALGGASGGEPSPRPKLLFEHPSGRKFLGAFASCERPFLEMGLADSSGTPLAPLALGIVAPRPAGCQSLIPSAIPHQLLGYTARGAVALVGGEVVVSSPEDVLDVPLAFPTEFGLAVERGKDVEIWSVANLASDAECAVTDKLSLGACFSGGKLLVFRRPEKTTP